MYHVDLNRRRLDIRRLWLFLPRPQTAANRDQRDAKNGARNRAKSLHCFSSASVVAEVAAEGVAADFVSASVTVVRAPCASNSFLIASACPTGIVKIAP